MDNTIAFQGQFGAFSDLACREVFPDMQTYPCVTFEDTFSCVREGNAKLAMIPIENSTTGRVADIHRLLPQGGLYIVGEHYQPITHHLLGIPGTQLHQLRQVYSHVQALEQCWENLRQLGVKITPHTDTAEAAAQIAQKGERSQAAIASHLAAQIYGLEILKSNIQDRSRNTTRFLIMSRTYNCPPYNARHPMMTTFIFEIRSVPAALFKALGGFATNGINMTKLESYLIDNNFTAARFYADIEAHPDETRTRLAFEELRFFSHKLEILGVYPMHPFRLKDRSGE